MARRNDIESRANEYMADDFVRDLTNISNRLHIAEDREKTFDPNGRGPMFPESVSAEEMRVQIKNHRLPFYVYALCAPSGAAFYIGKGSGYRIFEHLNEAAIGKKSAKCDAIRACGKRIRFAIVLSCMDEGMSLCTEGLLIREWYKKLTNIKVPSVFEMVMSNSFYRPIDDARKASIILSQIKEKLKKRAEFLDREIMKISLCSEEEVCCG